MEGSQRVQGSPAPSSSTGVLCLSSWALGETLSTSRVSAPCSATRGLFTGEIPFNSLIWKHPSYTVEYLEAIATSLRKVILKTILSCYVQLGFTWSTSWDSVLLKACSQENGGREAGRGGEELSKHVTLLGITFSLEGKRNHRVGSTLRKRVWPWPCLPTPPQCLSFGKLLGQGSFFRQGGRCEPLVVKRTWVDTFCIHYRCT